MFYSDYLQGIGTPLFYGAGMYWQLYNGAIMPASPIPKFLNVDSEVSKRLLDESRAHLIRWSSDPSSEKTPWWWVVSDKYDSKSLSSNMRNQIKRGYKNCVVSRISIEWLAEFGYECYKKAFTRYRYDNPGSNEGFKKFILSRTGYESLFEYWGVFVEDHLAGYVGCIIEGEYGVTTTVIKYDPDYLQYYSSYALMDTLLAEYVTKRGLSVSNGTRSVSHDTNMQDFLLKFGFRHQYCRLNIQYRGLLNLAVPMVYHFRKLIPKIQITQKVKALLFQEEINRECQKAKYFDEKAK